MLNIVAFDLDLFHYRWIISSLSVPNQWNLSKIPLTCTKRISKIHRKIQEQRYLMNFPGVVNSMFSTRFNFKLKSFTLFIFSMCQSFSWLSLVRVRERLFNIRLSIEGKKIKKYMYFFKIKNEFSRQQRAEFDLSNLLTPRRLNIL